MAGQLAGFLLGGADRKVARALLDGLKVGLGNLKVAPRCCGRLDQIRDRVEREEGNDGACSALVRTCRNSYSIVEHEDHYVGSRAGHELIVDFARYAHDAPSNGQGAQLPACGNAPPTTTNALSRKLPDSIGAGCGRSAAAPG